MTHSKAGRGIAFAVILVMGLDALAVVEASAAPPIGTAPAAVPTVAVKGPTCDDQRAMVRNMVAERLTPLADDTVSRVPDFADWLFDWSIAFERERALIAAGAGAAYEGVSSWEFLSLGDRVGARLHREIATSFHEIAMKPDDIDARAEEAWAELVLEIDLRRHGAAPAPEAGAATVTGWNHPTPPGEAVDEALARAPLPVVSRLAGFAARRSLGLTIVGVGRLAMEQTEIGALALIPGLILGYGGAMVTALGLDYAITSADSALHRPGFEAELVDATRRLYDDMGERWTDRLLARLDPACAVAGDDPAPVLP